MQTPTNRAAQNWVLGVTALASFMMALDAMIITTAFAAIRAEFGSPVETLQWTVNAFNLTFAVLLLTGAALGDRFGRRRMFAAGLALFTLHRRPARWQAVPPADRRPRGSGRRRALVMPLAMALLSAAFSREERARALGLYSEPDRPGLILRPGHRRCHRPGLRLALDLLDQPANRPDHDRPGAALVFARLRSAGCARRRRPCAPRRSGGCRLVWGLLHGDAAGWASLEVMRRHWCWALRWRSASCSGSSGAREPMMPMRLFGLRAFSAGMPRASCFTRRCTATCSSSLNSSRRPRAWTPRRGTALAPLDRHAVHRRAARRAVVNRFGERPLVVTGLLMQAIGLGWITAIVQPRGCPTPL